MVRKVSWTHRARQQLREITDYLHREAGARTAKKMHTRISARTRILAANPYAGQREELLVDMGEDFRCLVEGNYKIVYYVTDERVYVVTVFDCRRDPVGMRGEVPNRE